MSHKNCYSMNSWDALCDVAVSGRATPHFSSLAGAREYHVVVERTELLQTGPTMDRIGK